MRRAEEIAAAVRDQAADGVGPVGTVEGREGGNGAAAVRQLEHRAVIVRAAVISRAEKIAAAVLEEAAQRGSSVETIERRKADDRAWYESIFEVPYLQLRSSRSPGSNRPGGKVTRPRTSQ